MESALLTVSPAPTVAWYDAEWIQAEAASAAKLAGRLYRAARGGGVVWNGDFVGEASLLAERQNAKLTRAIAEPTPLRRALAYARNGDQGKATSFRDFRFWLTHYEGITVDPQRDGAAVRAEMAAQQLFWA